jgi:hypothetical protein
MKNKLFFILIMVPMMGLGQNVKEDFAAINKAMQVENYTISLEYKTYLDNILSESLKSSIYVTGEKYRLEAVNVIKICDGKNNLIADHNNKMLIVSVADNMIELSKAKPQIDSFIAKAVSISFSKLDQSTGRYVIVLKDAAEKKIELDFNISTHVITRFFTIYNQKEENDNGDEQERSVEVKYMLFTRNLKVNPVLFDLSGFVVKKGKVYHPADKYIKYQLINLISKQD